MQRTKLHVYAMYREKVFFASRRFYEEYVSIYSENEAINTFTCSIHVRILLCVNVHVLSTLFQVVFALGLKKSSDSDLLNYGKSTSHYSVHV